MTTSGSHCSGVLGIWSTPRHLLKDAEIVNKKHLDFPNLERDPGKAVDHLNKVLRRSGTYMKNLERKRAKEEGAKLGRIRKQLKETHKIVGDDFGMEGNLWSIPKSEPTRANRITRTTERKIELEDELCEIIGKQQEDGR